MEVNGYKNRGRSKKKWMDCTKEDMEKRAVSSELTIDRGEWRRITQSTDPE